MKTSEQIDKLVEALAKAQGQFTNPEKNRTVDMNLKDGTKRSFNYADLPALYDASRKGLSENGLSHTSTIELGNMSVLVMRLYHSSGQWIETQFPLTRTSDIKGFAGEITYGKRYLFGALVGIAAEEDTDDSTADPTATAKDREKRTQQQAPFKPIAPKQEVKPIQPQQGAPAPKAPVNQQPSPQQHPYAPAPQLSVQDMPPWERDLMNADQMRMK